MTWRQNGAVRQQLARRILAHKNLAIPTPAFANAPKPLTQLTLLDTAYPTEPLASNIETESYEPKDLHTTVAYALGLPVEKRIHAMGGRPFFVGNRGKVIKEAFGSA